MKKLVIIALALLLAVPAVTFAGSATSRWDMTIGGYVKFDMVYADQGLGPDNNMALRKTNAMPGYRQNIDDEYGSTSFTSQETRLNFLVKGPDAWGAKTSAFTEFDFRGWGPGDRGGANLRHAFMKFDWANDSLLIGRFWVIQNATPLPYTVGIGDLPEAKNGRSEQITWVHRWGKSITTSLGVFNGARTYAGGAWASTQQAASNASRSEIPWLAGDINYKSDACGKIGANKLTFGTAGFIGYTKETWYPTFQANGVAYPNNNRKYDDSNVKSWQIAVYTFVPIIPEKNGNKANAMSFSGGAQVFSNVSPEITWGPVAGSAYPGAYARGNNNALEVAPTFASAWAAFTYNLTDKFQVNAIYANTHATNVSFMQTQRNPGMVVNNDSYIMSFSYDVNPAIKLGAQLAHYFTKYGNDSGGAAFGSTDTTGTGGSSTGKAFMARIAAYYFF